MKATQPSPQTATVTSAAAERLLTMKDVCERLQVSSVTGWRLHAQRSLKIIRVGRSIRVRESDLEAWIERNSSGGEATINVASGTETL